MGVIVLWQTTPAPWTWAPDPLPSPSPGPTLLLNSDIIRARLGASALDRCVLGCGVEGDGEREASSLVFFQI